MNSLIRRQPHLEDDILDTALASAQPTPEGELLDTALAAAPPYPEDELLDTAPAAAPPTPPDRGPCRGPCQRVLPQRAGRPCRRVPHGRWRRDHGLQHRAWAGCAPSATGTS